VSLQKHSFSELTSPSARYLDEFLKFNQSKNSFEQGVTLNFIDALSSVNDVKINNYSSVYLTTVLPDTIVFSTDLLKPVSQNIVTYFSILSSTGEILYLNFSNLQPLSVANSTELAPTYTNSYSFTLSSDELNTSSLYYQLELINENTCRIKHTRAQLDFYLVGGNSTPYSSLFYFITSQNVDELPPFYNSSFIDGFDYVLDISGFIYLTKWVKGDYYLVTANNGVLGLTLFTSNTIINENNCLFRIAITDTSISPKLNSSWVSYKPDQINNLVVNTARSVVGLKNNSILHFEY